MGTLEDSSNANECEVLLRVNKSNEEEQGRVNNRKLFTLVGSLRTVKVYSCLKE